jgi:hypothetical protein
MLTDEQKQQLSPMPYWQDYLCFPQPCWHNISPGKTTMAEALEIIQSDPQLQHDGQRESVFTFRRISSAQAGGYIETSNVLRPGHERPGIVYGMYINEASEHELQVQDAITIYGMPLALHYVFTEGPRADGIYIYFAGNVVAKVYDLLNPRNPDVYPHSKISQMHYRSFIYKIPTEHPWRGYSQAS